MNERNFGTKDLKGNERINKALGNFKHTGRALINIDYTNDFVASNGALTCGESAQRIEDEIVDITKRAMENGDFIVYAVDLHKENDEFHPETKLFPPHNIDKSEGRQLYGSLNMLYLSTSKDNNVWYMDKTRYSAFAGTNLEQKLRERGIDQIDLVGVCTDICVLHTAIDAFNRGFKLRVHSNAVASFNQAGHEWAIGHMKSSLGAEVL